MSMLAKETRLEVRDRAGSYAPTGAGSGAVPAGYKRTELGVFPEDWQIRELADWKPFVTSGSRGWADYYSDHGAAFIRITNMSRGSIYLDLDDLKFVNLPPDSTEGVRTRLQDGDLLVSITADIGIIAFVDSSVPKPAYINQHIALVRLDPEKVDSRFLSYFLASERPQKAFRAGTDRGAKAGMNLRGVREIKAAFPLLAEQRAIAAALSDVDALLAKLDQLIAKKRDLKQAAMQQLLTGRVRLPGFTGEWSLKCLGEISEISMGRTPSRLNPGFWGPGSVWLSIADMNCKVVSESKEEITALAAEGMSLVRAGTLLMSFKLSIGRLAFAGCDLYTNEAICAFSRLQANAEFLYYALQRTDFSLYGKQAVKGYTLNKQSLKLVEVKLPEPEEQEAIASILSDMDAELATLEARRAKTRELKQGMMQALLTGRIRLI